MDFVAVAADVGYKIVYGIAPYRGGAEILKCLCSAGDSHAHLIADALGYELATVRSPGPRGIKVW
jgi:hypothetical protein